MSRWEQTITRTAADAKRFWESASLDTLHQMMEPSWAWQAWLKVAAEIIAEPGTVFEPGCGIGVLADLLPDGCSYYGCDINPVYVGGSVMKTQKRLTNIKTYFGVDAITDYRLAYTYSPDSGPSLLNSVTACSGDGTSCLPPQSFAPWQTGTGKNDLGPAPYWGASTSGNAKWTSTGDINGDGFADLFWIVPGSGSGSAPGHLFAREKGSTSHRSHQSRCQPADSSNGGRGHPFPPPGLRF